MTIVLDFGAILHWLGLAVLALVAFLAAGAVLDWAVGRGRERRREKRQERLRDRGKP